MLNPEHTIEESEPPKASEHRARVRAGKVVDLEIKYTSVNGHEWLGVQDRWLGLGMFNAY